MSPCRSTRTDGASARIGHVERILTRLEFPGDRGRIDGVDSLAFLGGERGEGAHRPVDHVPLGVQPVGFGVGDLDVHVDPRAAVHLAQPLGEHDVGTAWSAEPQASSGIASSCRCAAVSSHTCHSVTRPFRTWQTQPRTGSGPRRRSGIPGSRRPNLPVVRHRYKSPISSSSAAATPARAITTVAMIGFGP